MPTRRGLKQDNQNAVDSDKVQYLRQAERFENQHVRYSPETLSCTSSAHWPTLLLSCWTAALCFSADLSIDACTNSGHSCTQMDPFLDFHIVLHAGKYLYHK